MFSKDRKHKAEFVFASTMLATGLVLCGFSLVTMTRTNMQLAQATPPVQTSPPEAAGDKPAESKPGGTRPTTPAPEPARPDADAQKEGAKAALPPAPPEKIAPPMLQK
jgi:hypothetical protein